MNDSKELVGNSLRNREKRGKWVCLIPYFLLTAALLAIDQTMKFWAEHVLQEIGTVDVVDGVLSFTYVRNYGAAFGMLAGQKWLLLILTSAVLVVGVWFFVRNPVLLSSGAAVFAGAAGNLIDRFRLSYVIDFFEIRLFQFPVFNFADCCVVLGMIVVSICILRGSYT